jgi:hypothetical protein
MLLYAIRLPFAIRRIIILAANCNFHLLPRPEVPCLWSPRACWCRRTSLARSRRGFLEQWRFPNHTEWFVGQTFLSLQPRIEMRQSPPRKSDKRILIDIWAPASHPPIASELTALGVHEAAIISLSIGEFPIFDGSVWFQDI